MQLPPTPPSWRTRINYILNFLKYILLKKAFYKEPLKVPQVGMVTWHAIILSCHLLIWTLCPGTGILLTPDQSE